jgi:hypothetical protein
MPAIRAGFVRAFPNFWEHSANNAEMPSQTMSMAHIGNSALGPSRKAWGAQELGSKSTLDILDEESHPPASFKLVIARPDYKHELMLDSEPNPLKPFPFANSRPVHISSLQI